MKITLTQLLLAGCGGFLGSTTRYALGAWWLAQAPPPRFPWSTFTVNVTGCLLVGVLAAVAERHAAVGSHAWIFLVVGVLGGYTTFSAFGLETLLMLRRGDVALASGYVAGSVLLGMLAVWAGWRIVGVFARG